MLINIFEGRQNYLIARSTAFACSRFMDPAICVSSLSFAIPK